MLALRTAVRKVERLAYCPDGTRLAVGGPTGTEVIQVADGETVALLDWATSCKVAFQHDGVSLLLTGMFVPSTLFNLVDRSSTPLAHSTYTTTPDIVHLFSSGDLWLVAHPNLVTLRKFIASRHPSEHPALWAYVPVEPSMHPSRVTVYGDPLRVVFLATVRAAAREHNTYLYLLDGETGELIRRHRCGYGSVEHFTGSPCGGYLVGFLQATLIVWDTATLHLPPQRWANDSRKQFTGVAFHPHGRYLLTASNDKSVKLWDLTCGQVVRSYDWAAGRMRSVAVAPDGLTAAAGSDENLVVLFDLDM